jgi:sporulation protein YlmC with PRC-barrel domain
MRLSDLLTSEVVDESGQHFGHVRDVRLARDGPWIEGFGPAYRIESLIVGKGSLGARLGYDHEHMERPWLLRGLFSRHQPRSIPWSDVLTVEDERVRVRSVGHDRD